jgi:hypothetical protein
MKGKEGRQISGEAGQSPFLQAAIASYEEMLQNAPELVEQLKQLSIERGKTPDPPR